MQSASQLLQVASMLVLYWQSLAGVLTSTSSWLIFFFHYDTQIHVHSAQKWRYFHPWLDFDTPSGVLYPFHSWNSEKDTPVGIIDL